MKNEEFPVLLGIHCCQSELPAGAALTPGSGYSGAFVEMMSAECCPRPTAVVTAPPLKQSLYLPLPPFFVCVLLCRAPRGKGPLLPSCGAQSHSSSAHRDLGVPCATAPPVATTRAQLRHSVFSLLAGMRQSKKAQSTTEFLAFITKMGMITLIKMKKVLLTPCT